mmetsp:Transcript_20968/g.21756  ORF Transcript_20968/g.21756 Transcript_20968/m.21756 type:complete len:353 (-) Transcript_20968:9-1067(-)
MEFYSTIKEKDIFLTLGKSFLVLFSFKETNEEGVFYYDKPECFNVDLSKNTQIVSNEDSVVIKYSWTHKYSETNFFNFFINQGHSINEYRDILQKIPILHQQTPFFFLKEHLMILSTSIMNDSVERGYNNFFEKNSTFIDRVEKIEKIEPSTIITKKSIESMKALIKSLNLNVEISDKTKGANLHTKDPKVLDKLVKETLGYFFIRHFACKSVYSDFVSSDYYESTFLQKNIRKLFDGFWEEYLALVNREFLYKNKEMGDYVKERRESKEGVKEKLEQLKKNKKMLAENKEFIAKEDADLEVSVYCKKCKSQPRNCVGECNHLVYCDDCIKDIDYCDVCVKPIGKYLRLFRC